MRDVLCAFVSAVAAALAACLGGCALPVSVAAYVGGGVPVASVAAIHRTPPDAVWSLVTGRDCSLVRLDQGKSYCKPEETPPEPVPFCTRSLARVDCWQDPATVPGRHAGVADAPALTAAQEADMVRGWP
jgi:hypothetical protein